MAEHISNRGATSANIADISTPDLPDMNTETWSMKYNSLSIMDDVEHVEWYRPGGYCPVDVGETINDRFKVVHKLGHGGIATVWLCWDLRTEQWRALKINAADHSSEDCADLKIVNLLSSRSISYDELESNHITLALETFFLNSPNGKHLCFVLPVAGPRLMDWRPRIENDFSRLKYISYQLVQGLAFLHRIGICHGDFRPDNILMKLRPGVLDNIGYDEMVELVGEPIKEPVLDGDGNRSLNAPQYCYIPFNFLAEPHLISDYIGIVDFGEAYEVAHPPETLNIPIQYAGPEFLFINQTGIGNDIWSLAYTLLEFQIYATFPCDIPKIIRRMERYIGPVPPTYGPAAIKLLHDETKWDDDEPTPDYRDNEPITGSLTELTNEFERRQADTSEYSHPLQMVLGLVPLSRDELLTLADLLGKLFQYIPEERLEAHKALEHNWFKDLSAQEVIQTPTPREDERHVDLHIENKDALADLIVTKAHRPISPPTIESPALNILLSFFLPTPT